jgi:hypothetical protein
VAALVKRCCWGTHQGGLKPGHLRLYLDEFSCRFNRRHSRARGMLFYRRFGHAIQAEPRPSRSLVPHQRSRTASHHTQPTADKRVRLNSL